MREEINHGVVTMKETGFHFLGIIGGFFAPVGLILLGVGAFIGLDMITGWYKYKAKPEGANSKGLRMGFGRKSILYCGIVASFYIIDVALINEFVKIVLPFDWLATKAVASVLIWIELISINENFQEIKGVSLIEAFRRMTKGIKKVRKQVEEIRKNEE